jgi:subtilisin family serine protease
MKKLLSAAFFLAIAGHDAAAQSYAYSPQDALIGATAAVQSSANNGAGITFGVIDTGAAAAWVGFGGRVSTTLSTCTISGCPQSLAITDDNGHGTFTTSQIIGSVPSIGLVGVAPAANAIAVKVLNAQGSGSVADVASGITYAVNHGAQVLNLSMTFVPTADLVKAINYAASKNAVVVFAGGNSSQAFLNGARVSGFTDAAIKRMFFMGSTNASLQLSRFSNTPGKGGFVSTSNSFYGFSTRWLMADGENIWGASNYHTAQNGYSYITQMSGTSMSAPQGAGAAGLLAARWPFLLGNGNIPQILLQTGQDLGAKGVDTVYGEGFLRVDQAFQPVGQLAVPVNGKMVPATGAQVLSSGALGNMSKVAAGFQQATAYDNYSRDFPIVIASSIVAKSSTTTSSASSQVLGQSGPGARSFSELPNGAWLATSFSGTASAPVRASASDGRANPGFIENPALPQQNDWSVAIAQKAIYVGVGQGSNGALSFNDARWGGRTAFFNSNAGAAGALLGLASGASFATAGIDIARNARIAFSVLSATDNALAEVTGSGASAHGAAVAYTFEPVKRWKLSLTTSFLDERNMLLGSPSGGFLGLGPTAFSMSFGIGSNLDLGDGYQLGFDTAIATTDATRNADSLIAGTSRLTSAAFGIAFRKDNLTDVKDSLGVSLRKPFRVYAGSAELSVPSGTDLSGNPVILHQRVGLAPAGNETDLELAYYRPLGYAMTGGLSLTYRHDADNVAGVRDGAALIRFKASF